MRKRVEALAISSALILGACSSGEAETTAIDEATGTQSPVIQPEAVEASPASVAPVETTLPEPAPVQEDDTIGNCNDFYYDNPSNSSPTYIPGDIGYNKLSDPNVLISWQEELAEELEFKTVGLGTLVCYATKNENGTTVYGDQLLTQQATDLVHHLVSNRIVVPQERPTSD